MTCPEIQSLNLDKLTFVIVFACPCPTGLSRTCRKLVTSVENVNVIDRQAGPATTDLPFGRPYALIFLNLCPAKMLLRRGDDNRVKLTAILTDMASLLAYNGSLVVTTEDMQPDNDYLKCTYRSLSARQYPCEFRHA